MWALLISGVVQACELEGESPSSKEWSSRLHMSATSQESASRLCRSNRCPGDNSLLFPSNASKTFQIVVM